jgi:hypothetical protein
MRYRIEEGNRLLIPVMMGLSSHAVKRLSQRLEPPPREFQTLALIDTGASITVVSPRVIHHLRAVDRGVCRVTGVGAIDELGNANVVECLNYDLSLTILGSIQEPAPLKTWGDIQALAAPGGMGDHEVLIGLDVLSGFTLTASWGEGWFDLSESSSSA